MKRSDFFIRLMTGILFLAVAVTIGYNIYDTFANPYETTIAVAYTVEEAFPAEGYIIRTETVLSDFSPAVLPVVREGEKVASGQAIAVEYSGREALQITAEIRSLSMKIAGLEASGGISDAVRREALLGLSAAVSTADLRKIEELALDVETSIFVTDNNLLALKNRLEDLQNKQINTRTVYAPVSGNFSLIVDGFEHMSPGMINDMVPSDLHAHFRTPQNLSGAGKLVTGFRWYYAAVMNYDEAIRLPVGQTRVVQFSGAYQAHVEMLIESISKREENKCVVIFSSDKGIHNVASLRYLRAVIINNVYTGIRVPKEAVRLDYKEDKIVEYIYLQTSGYAERVDIERMPPGKPFETADYYLVRDGVETGSPLRTGSTIIVKGSDLYHGKVVG